MGALSVVFILAVAVGVISAGKHDIYSKYSVHGVKLRNHSDQQLLHQLESILDLDVWQHGVPMERDASIMVSPDNSAVFLSELDKNGIVHHLEVEDVSASFEEFDEELSRYQRSKVIRQPFDNFPRYAEVNAYIERIAAQYPDVATVVTAGRSFEGRDIKYLKISSTNFTDTSKPIYFMDAMIHAREWVTTPVTLYAIHRLVEDLRSEDRDLLEGTDWIILPIVNPDGYEFSHTNTRLWRRTRSFNPAVSATCIGIDANRNFDIAFNTVGVSQNPCSDTYPGHAPFSEPETGYVRNILFEHLDRTQLYMNIHSHGNYVLYGFGNRTLPANVVDLHHIGAEMGAAMDAMRLPAASVYLVGNSAAVLYGTSGSAQDYAQEIGVPFSYTLELPGYGRAFQVPPQYIHHINEETWQGIATSARLSKNHYSGRY